MKHKTIKSGVKNIKKQSHYFIFVLLIFLVGCSPKEKKQENVLYNVGISEAFGQDVNVNISEIAEGKIEYVALDSDKKHLLAQNPDFYLNGNEIIAFAQNQIYVFDRTSGKFLREIGHYGNDPGGYKKVVQTFPFDEGKKLVYTSGWDPKSYYRYSADGSFSDKVTAYSIDKEGDIMDNVFGEIVTSIAPLNDTSFVGYVWNIDGKQEAKLIVFNENNHRIKIFPQYNHFDYDIKRDGISVYGWNAKYYQLDNQLHFYERFTDTVYTVSMDTLLPKFVLNSGETSTTNATDYTKSKGEVPFLPIENVFESNRYLFFKIRKPKENFESEYYYGYFDKKSQITKVSNSIGGFENDINNFIPFRFVSSNQNDEIIGFNEAYEVKLWFDENPEKRALLSPELQKLKTIKETDNPVVMIVKLKE
ncbi:DUF4934 domain-containing protein [Maribellus maritimus]|uniref:DUF4934 domain-containing protein n=1 Tax=Maribellus maritimus TaxID=2870838 RepID=UPI001EEA0B36|nr:DUF4934 domain-containing protein [Maribellus maritimus]MCG6189349.1 DUF4934 domain-containing protein [Maribellus maritimus]